MLSFRIVEKLDIIEHIITSLPAGCVGSAPNSFPFRQLKEAFSHGIIMAIATPTHAGF
jgi:hypothetical protein